MRAAVARALALSPRMIVFDEPTSGLEPAAARRFDALLLELRAQGVGALVVSRDLPSILRARSWKVPAPSCDSSSMEGADGPLTVW